MKNPKHFNYKRRYKPQADSDITVAAAFIALTIIFYGGAMFLSWWATL